MNKGVDISMFQEGTDFSELKRNGFNTVIIKATEGVNYIDPLFEQHYNGALSNNMLIGFYHFMSDKTSPNEQAQDFWNAIKGKKFQVIPVLDIEKETQGRNATQVTDRCLEFLNEFKILSGYDCVVYTYTNFANTMLDSRLSKYKLWIAEYGVSKPSSNRIWGNSWVGFQYSENATIGGLKSKGDADVFNEGMYISNQPVNEAPISMIETHYNLWEHCTSGSIVEALQEQLNIQFNAGLKVDGYFGDSTLNACPLVRIGAKGNITRIIQERLISLGYTSILSSGGADGVFGEGTETAIENLQRNRGISVDGVVGKDTWKQLFLLR